MRTIKFKAKRVGDGSWFTGDILYPKNRAFIHCESSKDSLFPQYEEVDPATVCQFTGLTDKNGKEVYEGDVLRVGSLLCIVVWVKDSGCFSLKEENGEFIKLPGIKALGYTLHNYTCTVEGSIHDPEWKEKLDIQDD